MNLPVRDLAAAIEFYTSLGYQQDARFSDENASNVQISDTIVVMLLSKPFFQTFTSKTIASEDTIEALMALSADSREEVDALTQRALDAGGTEARAGTDEGFMYGRAFEDLDGHLWEIIYMNESAFAQS